MVLTLWLPLIIGEPSLLQPCPMHGAAFLAAAANGAMSSGMAHRLATGMAHEAHAVAGTPVSGHDHSSPGHHHICTCIGCCAGSPAAVPTFGTSVATIVVATYVAASEPVESAALPRPAPPFSRPFTTGPPRA
jgi:hypothetical protein